MKYKTNILYIHPYSGSPSHPREGRPYYLSKYLTKLDANVDVLTSSYTHLHRSITELNLPFHSESVDGINFVWLKVPFYNGNGFNRIRNMLSFGINVFNLNIHDTKISKPDLIVASTAHPFHILGAIRLARKYKSKLFFEIRDPWPLSLNKLLGLSRFHPMSIALYFCQFLGLKFSDKVISLQANLKGYLVRNGMSPGKFVYVCNGIDVGQPVSSVSSLDTELSSLRDKYRMIFMYTGSHGVPNALEYVISGFNKVNSKDVALVLIGDGIEKQKLQDLSTNQNCFFYPSIPKEEISKVLSYSDVCVISWLKSDIYQYGLSPNKIFDYMWAKKAIIQSVISPRNQVELGCCGENILPESTESWANAFNSWSSKDANELNELGENGYNYLIENFKYDVLASNLLKEYKDL